MHLGVTSISNKHIKRFFIFIRHNENITCKVVNDGKAYVFRIHQPIEGFCVSLIKDGKSDEKLIRAEVELLQYMTGHGFPGLQQPVANLQGE